MQMIKNSKTEILTKNVIAKQIIINRHISLLSVSI